jgi:hypothetical protein
MGCHPRIESKKHGCFVTTRSRNSELWFHNNTPLEKVILGYVAKFSKRYSIKLYAIAVEGSHTHQPIATPEGRRADYMRDLNSCIARAVPRYTPEYPGGSFWERRYSPEVLPAPEDLENYFFYTVLQPVQDGLVEKISEYPWYNCFYDAVNGIEREYEVVDWARYNADRRYKRNISFKDYIEVHVLKYERLPGYEALSQKEYALLTGKKLEERRVKIVEERLAEGKGFLGREKLLMIKRGSRARNPKKSDRYTPRPRVLCVCPVRRDRYVSWYFRIYNEYKSASKRYRAGEQGVKFPPGTYKPRWPYCTAEPEHQVFLN